MSRAFRRLWFCSWTKGSMRTACAVKCSKNKSCSLSVYNVGGAFAPRSVLVRWTRFLGKFCVRTLQQEIRSAISHIFGTMGDIKQSVERLFRKSRKGKPFWSHHFQKRKLLRLLAVRRAFGACIMRELIWIDDQENTRLRSFLRFGTIRNSVEKCEQVEVIHLWRFIEYHVVAWTHVSNRLSHGGTEKTGTQTSTYIAFFRFQSFRNRQTTICSACLQLRRLCNRVMPSCPTHRYIGDTLTPQLFSSSKTELHCCNSCYRMSKNGFWGR